MPDKERKKYLKIFYKICVIDIFDLSIQYKDTILGIKQYFIMFKYGIIRKNDTRALLKTIINKISS